MTKTQELSYEASNKINADFRRKKRIVQELIDHKQIIPIMGKGKAKYAIEQVLVCNDCMHIQFEKPMSIDTEVDTKEVFCEKCKNPKLHDISCVIINGVILEK